MSDFNDYTKIKGKKYFNWVKRIKQAHLSNNNDHSTLCSMPMLGNNYSKIYKKETWVKCPECYYKATQRGK